MNKNTGYAEKKNIFISRGRKYFSSNVKSFGRGDIIIKQDAMAERALLLLNGVAVMKSINDNGEESILDLFGRGDVFGGMFTPAGNVNLYYIVAKKNCDMICANSLRKAGSGFGTDTNIITMITRNGNEELEIMSKFDAANIILSKLRSMSE